MCGLLSIGDEEGETEVKRTEVMCLWGETTEEEELSLFFLFPIARRTVHELYVSTGRWAASCVPCNLFML